MKTSLLFLAQQTLRVLAQQTLRDLFKHRAWAGVLLIVGALTACTFGPRYAEVASSLPPINDQKARIIFFREAHFVGSALSPRVKINGHKVGELPNGSALIVNSEPGDLKISVDLSMERETLEFPFSTRPGEEYYVEVAMGPPAGMEFMMGALGSYLSTLRADDVKQFCSIWCAQVRTRAEALEKLSDLHIRMATVDAAGVPD